MDILYAIFLGAVLAQLLYIGANWRQYRRADYGWYMCYQLLVLLYFICLGGDILLDIDLDHHWWKYLFYSVRFLAFASYAIYFRFIRSFLQTRQNHPQIHGGIARVESVLWLLAVVFLVWEQALGRTTAGAISYFVLSLALFGTIIWLIARLWNNADPLSKYILRGAIVLAFGAFFTNVLILLVFAGYKGVFAYYLLPLQAGILAEMYFFNNGLTYKSRLLEQELIQSQQQLITELRQKQELQERLENMRGRISRDLHDALGSSLSSIRMVAETAAYKQPAALPILHKLAHMAGEAGKQLSEMIWSGSSTKDNAESLLLYLRQYAADYLEQAGISCTCLLPEQLPLVAINGERRRHMLLVLKEALHNIVKHAAASHVHITMQPDAQGLLLVVADDGKGIPTTPPDEPPSGNGLANMRYRMEKELHGTLHISSSQAGTSLHFFMPWPSPTT